MQLVELQSVFCLFYFASGCLKRRIKPHKIRSISTLGFSLTYSSLPRGAWWYIINGGTGDNNKFRRFGHGQILVVLNCETKEIN